MGLKHLQGLAGLSRLEVWPSLFKFHFSHVARFQACNVLKVCTISRLTRAGLGLIGLKSCAKLGVSTFEHVQVMCRDGTQGAAA